MSTSTSLSSPEHPTELQTETQCANCKAPTPGPFCSQCGQRLARRITFRRVFDESLEHVLALDSAFGGPDRLDNGRQAQRLARCGSPETEPQAMLLNDE